MLRKSALVVLFLPATLFVNAQFKKGDRMVGASIGTIFFNSGSTDNSTSISTSTTSNDNYGINLAPSIGWFINDNVAIGIMPSVAFNKQKILGKAGGNTFLK